MRALCLLLRASRTRERTRAGRCSIQTVLRSVARMHAAAPLAARGAPDALRTCFLAAYVRLNQPFLGGEGDEAMFGVFRGLLVKPGMIVGPRVALARERPENSERGGAFLFAAGFEEVSEDRQDSSQRPGYFVASRKHS